MFDKILIANRGEIAVRIARTCKSMGIDTVAVHSDADEASPHVEACDEAVHIGPARVRDSYTNVDSILAAMRRTGAQAVHPGYGFLSESAAFARAVADAGFVFIGPPPASLESLGDKVRAREIAVRAGVRVVPGTTSQIADTAIAASEAERIGYPVIVKAVAGGGGIGMQVVVEEAGLDKALRAASGLGHEAFGDDRVFIERYIERPRHVEIQLLADSHGQVIALGERECSIQRRHQKIIEESPAPALLAMRDGENVREAMCEAAVRIATEAGYVNAGTCEFIIDADGVFYFLEVNARLQVEHAVTEMVTGLDLVEMQLRIAAGEPLPDAVLHCQPAGHAVEARIYAENPAKGFFPCPGAVDELRWPPISQGEARIETGIAQGMQVTHYYDPMVAKVITHGPSRHRAVLALDRILSGTHIAPLKTNILFLRRVLGHESFRAGQYDTTYAERLAATKA